MTNSIKDRVNEDLQKAKTEGSLRADRIRQIVRSAVAQAVVELKEGSGEIGTIARDVLSVVMSNVGEKGKEAKAEINASVEGLIEGLSHSKRERIAETQSQVQQLQAQIDDEERKLETEIDTALAEVETAGKSAPTDLKSTLESAVSAIKDREEFAQIRQQYAKLKAQLAVLDANLAARYGDRYDEVKRHLDSAKTWYDDAKAKSEETGVIPLDQKQSEFEEKLGEAGSAIARKEQQIKQRLKELWHTATKL